MLKKILTLLYSILLVQAAAIPAAQTIVIYGGEIHTMESGIIKSGFMVIREGKIVDIGKDIFVPKEAEIIQAKGYVLYPGFIAPSSVLSSEEIKNYESYSPDITALDRFSFYKDYRQYLRGGVTAAYIAIPEDRLIPGQGALVKLSGRGNLPAIVKREAGLHINLGRSSLLPPKIIIFPAPVSPENPITPAKKQFPSSSLGAFWVIKNLFRFEPYSGDLASYMENISASLKKAQERQLPLIVRCQKAADIYRAVELAEFLKMPLVIKGGAEAYKLTDILKRNNVSVIAEALVRPNGSYPEEEWALKEKGEINLRNIPTLIKEGICLAISPEDDKYLADFLWITQYYRKYGIKEEELVRTITINPARIFRVEDRIGSLQKGRDADILFFQKEKGKPLPRLKKVMIEGRFVYENK